MTAPTLRMAVAQADFLVGDIQGNLDKVLQQATKARDTLNADMVIFPELALTGYTPEDLLLRPTFQAAVNAALTQLATVTDIHILLGYPKMIEGKLRNCAGLFFNGECVVEYAKQLLPNNGVFDERRYFTAGHKPCVANVKGHALGIVICEDLWQAEVARATQQAGATMLLSLNASPFHQGKQAERIAMAAQRVAETSLPLIYVNTVGGQDELVFDGGSFAMNADTSVAVELPRFSEQLSLLEYAEGQVQAQTRAAVLVPEAEVYQALVLAVRDYVRKCGFKGAVLGLSGGIDSALVLAIAVDAIGADKLQAVMMPYHYTASMSVEDAEAEARTLGVKYSVLPIEAAVRGFTDILAPEFEGLGRDTTEENLQARSRGVLLMAISNKKGYLVLTTSNKSEVAVGYGTLYGDMAGGFDVLNDVPKTWVFRLATYRNGLSPEAPPIPQRVIERPPSAELSPDQKDEDSLPPYPILDEILRRYVECDESLSDIVAAGFEKDTVARVIRMVDFNEYKRRQAPMGPKVTSRNFGKDRRYPVVNGWREKG